MLAIDEFSSMLRSTGIDFLTGVPCSYLKSFVSYANASGDLPYSIAASEGEAIGIAAGAYLGGKFPMVLIQNSGLGNCVNPLTSLSMTFDIPLILMVSHRGEGGKDAPQHLVMGEITYSLLAAMGIPAHTLPSDAAEATALMEQCKEDSLASMRPVAVVVPKGTFGSYSYDEELPPKVKNPVREPEQLAGVEVVAPRVAALESILKGLRPTDLVIATTGMTSRELFTIGDREGSFYMMGSMGCAPAIGLGLGLCQPHRRIVVIDGDGAFLMKMGTAATIGHYQPAGLLHILLDNGTYETTGGQPTASSTVDFERIALASGYRRAVMAAGPESLREFTAAFELGDGPLLCTSRILDGHLDGVGRVGRSPQQIRDSFREQAIAAL